MDLASLKNIDLKDIVAKLKSGGIADKKLLIQFGVGFGAILIFLIGYYAFVSPKIEAQEVQINLMNENKNKIEEFKNDIEQKCVAGATPNQSTEQTTENNTDQNLAENPEGQQVMYYKIPVEYEIQGNFLSYLKFRRALSKSQKVINFDKEEINVQKEIQGQILSKGTISIVGLPDEYN